jgi:hypothetical protein
MSHGKSFSRFHRYLAKQRRRALRTFKDFELPKDVLARKFKERKESLSGS